MTEAKWLASEDPAAMLRWFAGHNANLAEGIGGGQQISDRKLRLWVEACRLVCEKTSTLSFHWHSLDAEQGLDRTLPWWAGSDQTGEPIYLEHLSAADRCHLLRDIAGNPFRPVTLPRNPDCSACRGSGTFAVGSGEDAERMRCRCCPWLTPAAVSLAQAAYDDRDPATGHLDPVTLMAVADALEEAGCAGKKCPDCGGEGKKHWQAKNDEEDQWFRYTTHAGYRRADWMEDCPGCKATGLPHPLLAHLRSPGPHVRGCWVVDLILGKE